MISTTKLLKTAIALAAVSALTGCMTLGRDFKEPTPVDKFPTQVQPRTLQRMPAAEEDAPADSAITIDETAFMVRPVKPQEVNLPDFYVHAMSATESGVQDSLQLMLEGSGLTLNVEGGPRAMERFGATSIQNVHGSLRDVLNTLSEQIGFFWSASKGTLTIEPDRMFVVELPPVLAEDSLASMANTMQYLGARDTYLDRMSRTLVFRANRKTLGVIDQYLEGVRATRSMLVYEIKVYQVDLADSNTEGISWNGLGGTSQPVLNAAGSTTSPVNTAGSPPGTGVGSLVGDIAKTFALTATGTGLGAVIMGPKFSINSLVQFLKTQGDVKTVSQPRLAMLNGAKGMLRVGQTTTYVSKVGSNLSSGISQVTVETKDLRTGLELGITGEEHDSTVYTRVSLSLSELVRFNNYTTLGTELKLPDVTDRELNTAIRLPAGYTALLGGITVTRESDDRNRGIQQNTKTLSVQRSEIVMVLKPTIVRFKRRVDPPLAVASLPVRPLTPVVTSGPLVSAVLEPKAEPSVVIELPVATTPAPPLAPKSPKTPSAAAVAPKALREAKAPVSTAPTAPSPVAAPLPAAKTVEASSSKPQVINGVEVFPVVEAYSDGFPKSLMLKDAAAK